MPNQATQRGVEYGCAVTAQAVPDGTVQVAAGGLIFDNSPVSVAAVSSLDILTGHPADASLDRWDIVGVNSAGVVSLVVGTPGKLGPTGDDSLLSPLAHVKVGAGVTTITAGAITDVRYTIDRHISPYRVSNLWYRTMGKLATTASVTQNWMYLVPFFTGRQLNIQAISFYYTANFSAGAVARLGIYRDDGAGALSLLVDVGTITISSLAPRAPIIATTQSLTPGWWWFAWVLQGATKGTGDIVWVDPLGNSPVGISTITNYGNGDGAMYVTGVTGALSAAASPLNYGIATDTAPAVWVQATT